MSSTGRARRLDGTFRVHARTRVALRALVTHVERGWHYRYRVRLPSHAYEPDDLPAMEMFVRLPEEIGWNTFDLQICIPVVSAVLPAWSQSPKHPVVHFEIGCRRPVQNRPLLRGPVRLADADQRPCLDDRLPRSGRNSGHISALNHEPHRHTMFYVEGEDVQAYLDNAVALG